MLCVFIFLRSIWVYLMKELNNSEKNNYLFLPCVCVCVCVCLNKSALTLFNCTVSRSFSKIMEVFSEGFLARAPLALLHAPAFTAGWIFNLLDHFDLLNHSLSSFHPSAVTMGSSGFEGCLSAFIFWYCSTGKDYFSATLPSSHHFSFQKKKQSFFNPLILSVVVSS